VLASEEATGVVSAISGSAMRLEVGGLRDVLGSALHSEIWSSDSVSTDGLLSVSAALWLVSELVGW
jgi:hypothetical protein